ncbi:MAG: TolC family protein [Cyanobacteria bacterium]|nr:TolC family protein [Cyanobacteriota bacterium]
MRRLSPLLASLTVASSLAVPVAAAPKAPVAGAAGLSRSGSQAALLQLPEALPLAPALKGDRPKSNPKVLPPAATTLPPELRDLVSPASLALPDRPRQVRITQLRPLSLDQVEILAEVNNPDLKAIASQVEQAQSNLRAKIALWYPQLGFNTSSFPTYTSGRQFSDGATGTRQPIGTTLDSIWRMQAALQASWSLIDPTRTPQIAIARDQFEKAKNQYLIGLRDLRLQASLAYFDLQTADNQVQIGQEGVRASLVSLRDARARFQAGVATKLEVLEAETQLARDQQLLTTALLSGTPGQPGQATARRALAALLDLPQDVTPTAADPARVIGTWLPSLQESIVASFSFREELDQILLDISIANSSANVELGRVQPLLKIVNNFGFGRSYGYEFSPSVVPSITGWNVDNAVGLNLNWTIYDGGSAQANYRGQKQKAQENRFLFAQKRNTIRADVERSFYELDKNNRNILTTSREVISTRESLRLARLRFQAGVTTQREVVDTQRDLTQAEVRYSNAISDYNRALVELRRRTGLDQIATCEPPRLPANKPVVSGATDVPVEPLPLVPACPAARAQLPPAANRR